MKFIRPVSFLLTLFPICGYSQNFGVSANCNINSQDNTPEYVREYRTPPREATVKIFFTDIECNCTGTIVNRNTNDNNLGFYILTANHCLHGDDECGEVNLDRDHVIYFNYQSPDGNTGSTALSNEGRFNEQSDNLTDNFYEYRHETRLRLVQDFSWGDMALLEVMTPVPAHFNISYSGWNPSIAYPGNASGVPQEVFENYIGIHHPRGDIKKISTSPYVYWNENLVATDCYTVTMIIDYLFGWIWGRRFSTQVICSYAANPYFIVPGWHRGVTESGSSGSGLFNINNRQVGILSTGWNPEEWDPCNNPVRDHYGKFRVNYNRFAIKNTLNPQGGNIENRAGVDMFGMTSRKITCYDNLDLPGAPGVSGHYFPANHYQPENTISLQSRTNITTNAPIRVYDGADYRFRAPQVIDIDDDFEAEEGSFVVMENADCGGAGKPENPNAKYIAMLRQHKVPKHKALDMSRFAQGNVYAAYQNADEKNYMQIFPNPTSGNATLRFSIKQDYTIIIKNMLGNVVFKETYKETAEIKMSLSLASGTYIVSAYEQNLSVITGKLTIL